jgi:hypothetical protein
MTLVPVLRVVVFYRKRQFNVTESLTSYFGIPKFDIRLCDELIPLPEESYRLWYVVLCDL